MTSGSARAAATSFAALFSVVGLALYGLPLYYDFMVTEFGWSRTVVTSGNAISKLVVGPLFGFGAGWIIDRFGPRRLMMAGIVLAGGALVGLGAVTSLTMFYACYFLNAIGYVCGGPLPNQVLLSKWFTKTRGRMMGVAYLGIGIGGAVVPWIAHAMTERFGWRTSLQALGVLIVVIALPLAFGVREKPDRADEKESASEPETTGAVPSLRGVLTHPAFYVLALGSMCSIAAVGGTNQHLKLFLSLDRGYSQADATSVISLVLSASIVGRLLMGWLADRMPRKSVMFLIFSLIGVSLPILMTTTSPVAMNVFAVLFGLGLGGEYMIIPLVAAELFGVAVLGRVMGVIVTADGVAEATAPMLVGYLRESRGTYDFGFGVLFIAACAGAAAVTFLPRRGAAQTAAGIDAPRGLAGSR